MILDIKSPLFVRETSYKMSRKNEKILDKNENEKIYITKLTV